jgi:hypothetical protein
MNLHDHRPTIAALERFRKVREIESASEGALRKSSLDLVAALADYARTAGPGSTDDQIASAVRSLFQRVIAALASSDVPFTSGSPGKGGVLKSLHVDGLDSPHDLKGIGTDIMRKAARGLNVQAKFTKDVEQDLTGIESRVSSRVQKVADEPRKATSPTDPTAD